VTSLRDIPKVDKVLAWPAVTELLDRHPRPTVLAAVRAVLDDLRRAARAGELQPG